jgi:hypothetical protein
MTPLVMNAAAPLRMTPLVMNAAGSAQDDISDEGMP